jgi:hypothetical protein
MDCTYRQARREGTVTATVAEVVGVVMPWVTEAAFIASQKGAPQVGPGLPPRFAKARPITLAIKTRRTEPKFLKSMLLKILSLNGDCWAKWSWQWSTYKCEVAGWFSKAMCLLTVENSVVEKILYNSSSWRRRISETLYGLEKVKATTNISELASVNALFKLSSSVTVRLACFQWRRKGVKRICIVFRPLHVAENISICLAIYLVA